MILVRNLILVLVLSLSLAGCNTVSKVTPPNDEVLAYKLPYDLVYLRTLEALDGKPHWVLKSTEITKGIIVIRNSNYSNLDDEDLREITFSIKREDQETTSVSILPKYQHVPGGDELLKAISERISREIKA